MAAMGERHWFVCVAVVGALLVCGVVRAQSFQGPDPVAKPSPKSVGVAMALAIASPLVLTGAGLAGFALGEEGMTLGAPAVIVGWLVAPSFGHIYAGKPLTGLAFSGGRLAVVGVSGLLFMATGCTCMTCKCSVPEEVVLSTLVVGSSALTLWEWIVTPSAVHEYNETHNRRSYFLTPTVLTVPGHPEADPAYGMAFNLAF
jgi:hypothetical protein